MPCFSCFAEKYHWSTSTIRYWFIGRSLPQRKGILNIKEYLSNNIPCNSRQDEQIYEEIKNFFAKQEAVSEYYNLRRLYPMMNQFSGEMLEVCYDIAKNKRSVIIKEHNYAKPTGKTQVVVFDFDGKILTGHTRCSNFDFVICFGFPNIDCRCSSIGFFHPRVIEEIIEDIR